MADRFEEEYRQIYGLAIPDVAVEIVTWRLSAFAETDTVEPGSVARTGDGAATPSHQRPVVFGRGQEPIDVPVFRRDELGAGAAFAGPAIVEERETTAVIRPGWTAEIADDGSIVATRGKSR